MKKPNRFRFRAWDIELKKMIQCGFFESGMPYTTCYPDKIHKDHGVECKEPIVNGVNAHVMQSTGLCDINDVEIFEGDIISLNEGGGEDCASYTVRYNPWRCGLVLDSGRGEDEEIPKTFDGFEDYTGGYKQRRRDLKVIGNIYANPELLK